MQRDNREEKKGSTILGSPDDGDIVRLFRQIIIMGIFICVILPAIFSFGFFLLWPPGIGKSEMVLPPTLTALITLVYLGLVGGILGLLVTMRNDVLQNPLDLSTANIAREFHRKIYVRMLYLFICGMWIPVVVGIITFGIDPADWRIALAYILSVLSFVILCPSREFLTKARHAQIDMVDKDKH